MSGSVDAPTAPTAPRELVVAACGFALFFSLFFAPVTLSGRLLAPGDAYVQSLPAFSATPAPWSESLYGGYPAAADPTTQTWYPPRLVFAALGAALGAAGGAWNGFVVSAYALAAVLAWLYLRAVTGSGLAGAVGGLIYGLSGFLVAHLGHTSMIHGAAWLPLLLWGLERLRASGSPFHLVMAALAVGLTALAGHPQVLVYSLGTAGLYALARARGAAGGRFRYLTRSLAAVIAGIGLGAIQLVPSAELARLAVRGSLGFGQANQFALPVRQLPTLLFPNLFGSPGPTGVYPHTYFGAWNVSEVTGYVGLLSLALAGIALARGRPRGLVALWAALAVLSLALATGAETPLARLVLHLPGYNRFRAPGRHLMEVAMAAAVLAGMGADALRRGRCGRREALGAVAAVAAAMAVALILVDAECRAGGIANPALRIPLSILVAGGLALSLWSARPDSLARAVLVVGVLAADLDSFAGYAEWRASCPRREELVPPAGVLRLGREATAAHQRILPTSGGGAPIEELPVNLSRLWGVASASGYGPLLPERHAALLGLVTSGTVRGDWWRPEDRALDLLGVRYVLASKRKPPLRIAACLDRASPLPGAFGIAWGEELGQELGRACGVVAPERLELRLEETRPATHLALVTSLACGHHLVPGKEAARVEVSDDRDLVAALPLRAGEETAEGRYGCALARGGLRHPRAPLFEVVAQAADPGGRTCGRERFLAVLDLGGRFDVRRVTVVAPARRGTRVEVARLSLIDEATGVTTPLHGPDVEVDAVWPEVLEVGSTRVYENRRALPPAWVATEAVVIEPEAIRQTIRGSRLPDGSRFDPSRQALIEAPISPPPSSRSGLARLVESSPCRLVYQVESDGPALLVTGEPFYPGWRAELDGAPAPVVRADYVLRAVPVPGGRHDVKLTFHPASLYLGAAATTASALGLAIFLVQDRRRRRPGRGRAV